MLIGQINTNENQEIKNELQAFIDNLKTVNKLIYDIVENRPFFEILVSFLWELEKARKYYSKNPLKRNSLNTNTLAFRGRNLISVLA